MFKPNIEYIKQITAERQWSMRQLAVKMGISHSEVSRLFKGSRVGGKKTIAGIMRAFKDVSFDRLFILD